MTDKRDPKGNVLKSLADSDDAPSPLAQGIDSARIASFYQQAPGATRTNIALALVAVAVMWQRVPDATLWVWLGVVALSHVLRLGAWAAWRRDRARDRHWKRWARLCTLAMLASGAVWGAGSVAMFTADHPLLQAFWLILIAGIGAGVISANAFHPPAQWAYLLPLIVPVTMRHVMEGGGEHIAIAIGMTLYLAFCLVQGRHQAGLMRETLRIRFENLALVDELRGEKAEAEAARRVAEESNAARSRFFAAASHDLRQPLHALSLLTGALRQGPLDAERARMAAHIGHSVEALETLFDELLDISRLNAGAIVPRPADFPVQRLLDGLAAMFAGPAQAAATRLDIVPCAAVARGDEVLLGRIAANFVSNGLKYAQGGRVAVVCRRRGAGFVLQVRDNGPGIPASEHQRVFEEFYQLDNPARNRRLGFGLGLATVRRIGELLGATVSMRSRSGGGSVFEVTLERGDPLAVVLLPAAEAAAGRDLLHGATIAVIDDEPDIRAAMSVLLGGWGAQVRAAASAEDLLRDPGPAPELAIADLRLAGGGSGLDALRTLRARYGSALPALLVSGDTGPERQREAAESGLTLLHKPVRPVKLRAALNHLLAGARSKIVSA